MRVAVVGAGIMGASAARFLAKAGHDVTILEQFELNHRMGSSHGRSRIVRKAYPDAFYTEIMQEGYPLWAELQEEGDERLLYECGLLYFGKADSADMISMIEGLAMVGVPHEVFGGQDAHKVFPGLALETDEIGVWTPEAGWVHAEKAVRVSVEIALGLGAKWEPRRIQDLAEVEAAFDAVVLTPGGWIGKFVNLDVEVQERTFAYLECRQDGPVWIDDGPGLHYGFPSEPGGDTIKIGGHVKGEPFDPDRPDRPVQSENVEAIRDLARRRFGLSEPVVREAALCLYTRTPDEDFRIDRLTEKTVFASPCSGHGFKFGPWVGRYLSRLVEGIEEPSRYPRFLRKSSG